MGRTRYRAVRPTVRTRRRRPGCTILHRRHGRLLCLRRGAPPPSCGAKPVIVGASAAGRGQLGQLRGPHVRIRSAMPATRARRLCPHAAFLRPTSRSIRGVPGGDADLPRGSPAGRALSMDEAFLDVAGAQRCSAAADRRRHPSPDPHEQALTCSVGVRRASSWPSWPPPGPSRTAGRGPRRRILEYLHPLPGVRALGSGERKRRGCCAGWAW